MELVEMYCDLLLARFGLIQQMKTLDDGLAEAISSLIWVAPRLQTDIAELKTISDLLTYKYGKPYAQACRENALKSVNEKLMIKMGVQAPPKILIEKYLIGKCLIDLGHNNDNRNTGFGPSGGSGGGGGGGGFGAFVAPPPLPSTPPSAPYPTGPNTKPIGFNFGNNTQLSSSAPAGPPPHYDSVISSNESDSKKGVPSKDASSGKPTPVPRSSPKSNDTLPELPAVPTGSLPDIPTDNVNNSKDDSIDFEDLTKRFEELKKRK
ncbi:unnamed protein product [Sphagnum jensenii]|uniref:IST1 homolog n=1 Tax=Sphagnum jensenii TaxID=128206 RepID=A0ABP0VGT2_9BRYO